ncbi:hypothetical protein [Ferrovibrio terrae]|uniref:hypothetical protein n=1 Tax=Ferrovibrio terrae TaxID=2594003 RepID=UPI003137A790
MKIAALQSYRQQARQTGLGRVLAGLLRRRTGVNLTVAARFARAIKIAVSPVDYLRRRLLAMNRKSQFDVTQLDREGFLFVGRGIPNTDALVRHCAALFDRKKAGLMENYRAPYALGIKFENSDAGTICADPQELQPIVDYCQQDEVLNLVAQYIGEFPVIGDVSLMYTLPNNEMLGSQQFHRDVNQVRQLHMIVPIHDIDEDTGPFTFITKSKSSEIIDAIKHVNERVEDSVIERFVRPDDFKRCTGKAGEVYFLNAHDCFHYGARCRSKPRLMLIVNFTSRFEGLEGTMALYRCANRANVPANGASAPLLLNL